MLQKIYRRIISARNRYLKKIVIRGELRNVEKKKALWSKVELTSKKDREICDYWKKISGHEIDTRWHRLYASYLQCPVKSLSPCSYSEHNSIIQKGLPHGLEYVSF